MKRFEEKYFKALRQSGGPGVLGAGGVGGGGISSIVDSRNRDLDRVKKPIYASANIVNVNSNVDLGMQERCH